MKEIDDQSAIGALHEAVKARGKDYIYTDPMSGLSPPAAACVNWWYPERTGTEKGEPGCIVGFALHKLGVDMSKYPVGPVETVASQIQNDGIASFDRNALMVLTVAQQVQDRGATWGIALAAAQAALYSLQDFSSWDDFDATEREEQ